MRLNVFIKAALVLCAVASLFILNSCKSSGADPVDTNTVGRRDYTWNVDTLNKITVYNQYIALWGVSPSDVWCVSTYASNEKSLLHYNGKQWSGFKYQAPGNYASPYTIFGFLANEFLVGGNNGEIWKYNNGNFSKFGTFIPDGFDNSYIRRIWGTSPSDLYVAGCAEKFDSAGKRELYGMIMKYNGIKWEYLSTSEKAIQYLNVIKANATDNNLYLIGYKWGPTREEDSVGLFEYNDGKIKRLYFDVFNGYNSTSFTHLGGKLFFGFKEKVFTYEQGQFKEYLNFSGKNIYSMSRLSGRGINDFFLTMNDGIGHYNGSDLTTIFKFKQGTVIYSCLYFEKDVFFSCYEADTDLSYIVHGSLK